VGHLFAYDLPAVRFARILFAAPLLAASIAFAGDPWIVSGRVVGIFDGDTITVLDADKKQHKDPHQRHRRA
jgi:endonuclease YncB( thermonuclease family)